MIFYSEIYHSEAIPQELFRQMRVQCLIRGGILTKRQGGRNFILTFRKDEASRVT